MKLRYIKKIIKMLESGDYEQTTGTMCKIDEAGDHCFCVHGIAVEALAQSNPDKFGWEENGEIGVEMRLASCGDIYCLQQEHKEALGMDHVPTVNLRNRLVRTKEMQFWRQLMKLNDSGKSFKHLAERMRYFYRGELEGWTG